MSTGTLPRPQTLAELAHALGDIPLARIITNPAPGTATGQDALHLAEGSAGRLCEWIDATLVEKTMGSPESGLGGYILTLLNNFIVPRRLGLVTGEAGMFYVSDDTIRMPDVAFYSRERMALLPRPRPGIFTITPDLAVEVLSPSNTRREMARKRDEYFTAGVRLVWQVEPADHTVTVWSDVHTFTVLTAADLLTGGDVLPGFSVNVAELFAIDA